MNEDSIVATQASSLIRHLREEQAQKCRDIEREATAWNRDHVRKARRQARIKVQAAVRLARDRCRTEVAAAEAQLAAEQRRRRQAQLNALLSQIMERVPDALAARWLDANTRSAWIDAALRDAKRRLDASAWTIRHATGLMPDEKLGHFDGARLTWVEDAGLVAGLVVEKPGARMDASIDGLLTGSAELQSRVLRMLNEATGRS